MESRTTPSSNTIINIHSKVFVLIALVVLFCIGCGGGNDSFEISDNDSSYKEVDAALTIFGYQQNTSNLFIHFSKDARFRYVIMDHVPEKLDLKNLFNTSSAANEFASSIRIPLSGEPVAKEYSIIIFVNSGYVEIVRQSGVWLMSNFGFERDGGYSILGRRSIGITGGVKFAPTPVKVVGIPEKLFNNFDNSSKYNEVNLASTLLKNILDVPIANGPTNASYQQFMRLTYEQK